MSAARSLVWATDLDLHLLSEAECARVIDHVRARRPERLLLGGGISTAAGLTGHLRALTDAVDGHVSFVLAPSDYIGGAVAEVRAELAQLCATDPRLEWLALGHVVELDPGRALVGHGGFSGEGALAADARDRLQAPLHQAAARYSEVVVLTHLPITADLLPGDAEVCAPLGLLLREAAEQWPHTRFVVMCGGTDTAATIDLRPNLRVEHSGLRASPGLLRPLRWWPLAARPARPPDGDGPAPVRPVKEAATATLTAVSPAELGKADTRTGVFQSLHALAATPVDPTYPFTHGETAADWQAAFADAVRTLASLDTLSDVDHGGVSLVRWLRHLAEGPIAPVLAEVPGRVRLVGDFVRNVVFPYRINQGQKGTCAVTAVESWLAARHPAEYARVVAGLVRPEGRLLLYNGEPMTRDEDRMEWSEMEGQRSPTSRLFQVAGMEYADADTDYCNTADTHYEVNTAGLSVAAGTGLGISAFDRLLEGLTGEIWRVLTDQDDKVTAALEALGLPTEGRLRIRRDAETISRRALAAGDAVFVTLASPSDPDTPSKRAGESPIALPHKVRVMRFDDDSDQVHFEDPYDPTEAWIPDVSTVLHDHYGHCSMPRAEFFSLVVELSFQPVHAAGLPAAAP